MYTKFLRFVNKFKVSMAGHCDSDKSSGAGHCQ